MEPQSESKPVEISAEVINEAIAQLDARAAFYLEPQSESKPVEVIDEAEMRERVRQMIRNTIDKRLEGKKFDVKPQLDEKHPKDTKDECNVTFIKMWVPICIHHGVTCDSVHEYERDENAGDGKYPVLDPARFRQIQYIEVPRAPDVVEVPQPVEAVPRHIVNEFLRDEGNNPGARLHIARMADEAGMCPVPSAEAIAAGEVLIPSTVSDEDIEKLISVYNLDQDTRAAVVKLFEFASKKGTGPKFLNDQTLREFMQSSYQDNAENTIHAIKLRAKYPHVNGTRAPDVPGSLGGPMQIAEVELTKDDIDQLMKNRIAAIDAARNRHRNTGEPTFSMVELVEKDRKEWEKIKPAMSKAEPVLVPAKSAGLVPPNPERHKVDANIYTESPEQAMIRKLIDVYNLRQNPEFNDAVDGLCERSKKAQHGYDIIKMYFMDDIPTTIKVILKAIKIQEFI